MKYHYKPSKNIMKGFNPIYIHPTTLLNYHPYNIINNNQTDGFFENAACQSEPESLKYISIPATSFESMGRHKRKYIEQVCNATFELKYMKRKNLPKNVRFGIKDVVIP
jgi:hypothetical protein